MKKILKLFTYILVSFVLLINTTSCNNKNNKDVYYDVIFEYGEVEFVDSILSGDVVDKPGDPNKDGYKFLYWQYNNEEFDFNTKITHDFRLTPKFEEITYKVTFDANGGSSIKEKIYKENEQLGVVDCYKEHSTFKGWYLGSEKMSEKTYITSDLNLVAKYDDDYKVKVHLNNGEEDYIFYVKKGKTINEMGGLTIPTYQKHNFIAFYSDEECTTKKSFNVVVEEDFDLYVKWEEIYIIDYKNLEGATSIKLIESYLETDVKYASKDLIIPTKDGCFFRGYYESSDFTTPPVTKIEKGSKRDITLYARWVVAELSNAYFGILGDSISTYKGYIPSGFEHFYQYANDTYGTLSVDETWWRKTVKNLGCAYGVNNSYGGTTVMSKYGPNATDTTTRVAKSTNSLKLPPDIMVVMMGNNDALVEGIKAEEFEASYRKMLKIIYNLYPNVDLFLCTTSYEVIVKTTDERYLKHLQERKSVNDVIRNLALEFNLPLIDLDKEGYQDASYLVDSIHPNANGMNVISSVVTKVIKKYYE